MQKRRFAIGDIHGCYYTFKSMLASIELQSCDTLYIVGDMVNRGKYSWKVIKKIIKLQSKGYDIRALRGNHEEFIISEIFSKTGTELLLACKHYNLEWLLHKDTATLKSKYVDFLQSLPYYYKDGAVLLSHAGFDICADDLLANTHAMLNNRSSECVDKLPKGMSIIHGHTPTNLEEIQQAAAEKRAIINIDNGCVYKSRKHKGNLVCIDIDSYKLYVEKNID